MYGMTSKHWKQIFYILDEHCAHIRWVKLFGSRARGAYRNTSDIDLAIVCEQDIRSELLAAFEESRLPYTFDLVLYDARLDEKLRDMIDRDGKLLFCSVGGKKYDDSRADPPKERKLSSCTYSSTSIPRKRS